MIVFHHVYDMRQAVSHVKKCGQTIALVPTMGCLHEGHLSLIRLAKKHADVVVVSIYVNPLQFGKNEDLAQYPRPLESDLKCCENEGVDMVFCPENLYPNQGIAVSLVVKDLDQVLCGAHRPNHFNGVVTVVSILFHVIQPDVAVFGEKDYQQLCILKRMVHDLSMSVRVLPGTIIRAKDGLALSSRNRYLNHEERRQAVCIYQCLKGMQTMVQKGEKQVSQVLSWGRSFLENHAIKIQYLEVRDSETLQSMNVLSQHCGRVFIAANIGQTRLIDNLELPCN